MKATAKFQVEMTPGEPFETKGDVNLGTANISKTFTGDMEGSSVARMLSARCPDGGAGYVALEQFDGTLQGKSGSFCYLHCGTMGGGNVWGTFPIVPGSGTGELSGISGEGQIEVTEEDGHVFHLEYKLGAQTD